VIPKFSEPLSKLIRTGEGIVLFAFNAAALAGVIVNDVSPATGLKYAAIFNSIAFASRQFLKAVAVVKPSVGGDPIPLVVGGVDAESVLAEIAAAEQAAASIQAKPGTPAADVKAGLSPTAVADAGGFATGGVVPAAKPPIDVPAK